MEDNFFRCKGKLAACSDKKVTPGGIVIKEITISVNSNVPWKQKKISNLKIICASELALKLNEFKTGNIIIVEGVIEEIGIEKEKFNRLVALKIKKGEKQ